MLVLRAASSSPQPPPLLPAGHSETSGRDGGDQRRHEDIHPSLNPKMIPSIIVPSP